MDTVAIIQARISSTRLPGKILAPLGNSTILGWTVRAAQQAKSVDLVVVATSTGPEDDVTAGECERLGVPFVRGPLDDVLTRYVMAAGRFPAAAYVRLTADCPLLDPGLIDQCVAVMQADPKLDLVSNCITRTYPRGFDVEVLSSGALRCVADVAEDFHRAHVTTWMTVGSHGFSVVGLSSIRDDSDLRVTVDTPDDLVVVRALQNVLGEGPYPVDTVVDWLRANPEVAELSREVQQKAPDEG